MDRLYDPCEILVDVHVAHADDEVTARSQKYLAFPVMGFFLFRRMRCVVDFDNQSLGAANETGEAGSDRFLPDEFEPGQPPAPQRRPKPTLRIGLRAAKRPRPECLRNVSPPHSQDLGRVLILAKPGRKRVATLRGNFARFYHSELRCLGIV